MKGARTWNVAGRLLFLLAFAASAAVFWFARTGEGYMDLIINGVFDAVAALFVIIYFEGCARPLGKVVSSLRRVTEEIRGSRGGPEAMWERFSREQLFSNWRLDERYDAYVREVMRQQEDSDLTAGCDIRDYIDEQLISDAVNKAFCDQIGGIMTGLGILFTFIGLVYGLRNFDASSVDLMQTSTQALMAGIKIAFLTSIFGLVYSLLFGLCYKRLLRQSAQALYDFQDAYAERVRPSRENAVRSAMLRLQEEQIDALEQFGDNVGRQVGKAVTDQMAPVTDALQRTITKYVSVAIEDQRAGMERVVRFFLDSMNESLGNMFSQLKSRTEELARWEREMTVAVRGMVEGIGATGQDLAQAQASAKKIAETMASYTGAVQKLTEAQNGLIRDMQALADAYGKRREEESALLRAAADSVRAAAGSMDKSVQAALTIQDIAQETREAGQDGARRMAEAAERISAAAEAIENVSGLTAANISAAADRLGRSADRAEAGVRQSVGESLDRLEQAAARLSDSLAAAAAAMDSAARTIPAGDSGARDRHSR